MVEHNLAKVGVASSSLVSRSRIVFSFKASNGGVAEWLCSGLQSRRRRFDPDPRLHERWCLFICRDGETGRRKGFKIPREIHSRAGSIPARGTILYLIFTYNLRSLDCQIKISLVVFS